MGLGSFGGGIVGGATVKLLLDDAQYRAELDRAKAETASSASAMGGSASRFGAAAKAGFAVAGLAAATFAKDSIEATLQHEQVLAQFQIAMKNAGDTSGEFTKTLEDQAAALSKLTGYTQDEILAADTVLARFKLSKEQMQQAIPVVLDYARATGQDVPTAAGTIGKALLGNTRALKTVGIQFTATGNQGKDFASILDLLKTRVGGAAAAFGDTAAGKIAKFHAALHEAEIQVGQALIPVLQLLIEALKPLLPVIETIGHNFDTLLVALVAYKAVTFLPGLFSTIGTAVADLVIGTGALTISTEGLTTAEAGLAVSAAGAGEAVAASNVAMEATNPIALAAALGLGALYLEYKALKDPARALTGEIDFQGSAMRRWQAATTAFAEGLTQTKAAQKGLAEVTPNYTDAQAQQNLQWAAAVPILTLLSAEGKSTGLAMGDLASGTDHASASQMRAREVIAEAARALGAQSKSLDDVTGAWKSWRDSAATNLSFVQGALGDFAGKAHVNIGQVIADFQRNRREMNQFGSDLESIRQRGGKAADGLVQSLLNMGDQGVSVAHAIASANQSQFAKVIGIWNQTQNKASSFANQLAAAIIGPMDRIGAAFLVAAGKAPSIAAGLLIIEGKANNAAQAMAILQQRMDALHDKTVDIDVNIHYNIQGSGPPGGKVLP